MKLLQKSGNELGNHTWLHQNYIYFDALCNGQNPNNLDGKQIPYPSNDQMRNDCGNGCNDFGIPLDEPVKRLISTDSYEKGDFEGYSDNVTWGGI